MKMFKALLIGSALIAPAAANAAVIGSTGQLGAPFATLTATPTGGLLNGGALGTITGGAVLTSGSSSSAVPANVVGGTYLSAGPSAGQPAVLTFNQPVSAFGFIWGSPDSYNQLSITSTAGTFAFTAAGLGISSITGDQGFSQYVNFATSMAGETILSASFTNSPATNAFETANFAVAAVPEPATWGMMILGFGVVGGVMRRRSVKTSVTFA